MISISPAQAECKRLVTAASNAGDTVTEFSSVSSRAKPRIKDSARGESLDILGESRESRERVGGDGGYDDSRRIKGIAVRTTPGLE